MKNIFFPTSYQGANQDKTELPKTGAQRTEENVK